MGNGWEVFVAALLDMKKRVVITGVVTFVIYGYNMHIFGGHQRFRFHNKIECFWDTSILKTFFLIYHSWP